MQIGFIRHGETAWNALGKIQGQTDVSLNAEGVRQAEALAERLRGERAGWEAIAASDLKRAQETADIIARALDIPLLPPDTRLRERYFGAIEGTTEAERLARWGPDWRRADAGQESDASVRARGMAFVEQWQRERPDARLLVVSHGSFLGQLLQAMCGGIKDAHLLNMSFSILQSDGGGWTPLLHNCTLHLQRLKQQ